MVLVLGAEHTSKPRPVKTAAALALARRTARDGTTDRAVTALVLPACDAGLGGLVGSARRPSARSTVWRCPAQVAVMITPWAGSASRAADPPVTAEPRFALGAAAAECAVRGSTRIDSVRPAAWAGQRCAAPGRPR